MYLVMKDQISFWGPLDPMVDRGLNILLGDISKLLSIKTTLQKLMFI